MFSPWPSPAGRRPLAADADAGDVELLAGRLLALAAQDVTGDDAYAGGSGGEFQELASFHGGRPSWGMRKKRLKRHVPDCRLHGRKKQPPGAWVICFPPQ